MAGDSFNQTGQTGGTGAEWGAGKEPPGRGCEKLAGLLAAAVLGVPVGACVGTLTALFGRVLLAVSDFRQLHWIALMPFLAPAGALCVFWYQRYGKQSGKGMGLVFEVGYGTEREIPLRLIPFVMVSTWATHLFGGSAGREGVAVQIGAAVSHRMFGRLPIEGSSRIFLVTGMAAGFAGLFRTPFAAVCFAVEVLWAGRLEYRALLPALTASLTASAVSGFLGLEKFSFSGAGSPPFSLACAVWLLAAGAVFGAAGGLFAWALARMKAWLAGRFQDPVLRIAVCGAVLSLLLMLLYGGRYGGLGTNLIAGSLSGGDVKPCDWILKLAFTVLTVAAGFQGGEVTPLFSIGASLGAALSFVFPLPLPLLAALGYAAVFGGATNTFLAPAFIGAEVFGWELLPYFFTACAAARMFSGGQSIYGLQKRE